MKIAVDLDNCIDATPKQMQSIMSALMAAGHSVTVLTGSSVSPLTEADWQDKANYLTSLGCGSCWDNLVILAHSVDGIADVKAKWLADNGYDVLIDNSKDNARAATAAGVNLVLVPWASRS